jgi:hypothetical protein
MPGLSGCWRRDRTSMRSRRRSCARRLSGSCRGMSVTRVQSRQRRFSTPPISCRRSARICRSRPRKRSSEISDFQKVRHHGAADFAALGIFRRQAKVLKPFDLSVPEEMGSSNRTTFCKRFFQRSVQPELRPVPVSERCRGRGSGLRVCRVSVCRKQGRLRGRYTVAA